MAFNKKQRRLVRARATRINISLSGMPRLSVFRSNKHIYVQLVSSCGRKIMVSVSSLSKSFRERASTSTSGVGAASIVGTLIAEKAIAVGVTAVAFDRAGYKYHGRVKALADAARFAGLIF